METDIAEKMWNALITNNKVVEAPVDKIPLQDQIKFLKKNLDSISVKDRIDLGQIIIINDCKSNFKSCSEGLLVDLDKLPSYVVTQMYDLLIYKLNQ